MSSNSFYLPASDQSPGAWNNFWIPLLVGLFVLGVDVYLIPGIFALPVLLLMVLIFLAFRLPAWMVAIWTVMYAAAILVILFLPVEESRTDPAFKPYVRTAVFIAGGSAAVLLASYRRRLEKGHEALFQVILSLPLPVIVSDISGNILLLNTAAQAVLKNHISELSGLSFFSTFISPDNQGKTIVKYIGYFDPGHGGPIPITLQTRGAPPLTLLASLTVVAIDKKKYAVTVVEEVKA